jgi:N-sulfoglucosamine sulfohydrolase
MKAAWPPWYPTRTLEEWEKARAVWVHYVFREPGKDVDRPVISHSKRKNKKKSDKFEKSKKSFVR